MEILLVDDEETILRSMMLCLADFGHKAHCAADVSSALKYVERYPSIGLVVSDIRMPGLDGIAFVQMLRSRRPGLRTLLMTGYGDEEVVTRAFNAGASDYLKKPVRIRELLDIIESIEERLHLEREFLAEGQAPDREGYDRIVGKSLDVASAIELALESILRLESDCRERAPVDTLRATLTGARDEILGKVEMFRDVICPAGFEMAGAEGTTQKSTQEFKR